MLHCLGADIGEIVQIGVIVVDVGNGGEIQSRDVILGYGKVREIRHEAVNHRGKGVGERRFGIARIEFHHLAVSGTGLEQKGRAPRTTGLYVNHQSYIVEDLVIVLPYGSHTVQTRLFGIGEKNLDALAPSRTLLYQIADGLQSDAQTVAVIGGTVGPDRVPPRHRLGVTGIVMGHEHQITAVLRGVFGRELSQHIVGVKGVGDVFVQWAAKRVVSENLHRVGSDFVESGHKVLAHRSALLRLGDRVVFARDYFQVFKHSLG